MMQAFVQALVQAFGETREGAHAEPGAGKRTRVRHKWQCGL